MERFDVITVGRIGVDLYPEQIGRRLEQVETFTKSLGGSPTNVAVGAARLGCRSAVITRVGDDPFGAYLRAELERLGVDSRWVGVDPNLRTPVVFCEMHPPDDFPLLFYREPSAPDLQLAYHELDTAAIAAARVLWTTGTALSAEPSRSTVMAALDYRTRFANGAGDPPVTVHDLDHRAMFWEDERDARRMARRALEHATVAVGNQEEMEMAVETRDPQAAAQALLDLGVELAIVKRGPEGVYARTRQTELTLEPVSLDVVNGLGAGDAFGGALCAGLVFRWSIERTLRAANEAGAIVASRAACAPAMPTRAELRALADLSPETS